MDSFSLILDYNNVDKRTNDRLELQKIVASRSGWTLSRISPPNFLLFFFSLSLFFRRRRGSKLRCVKGTRKVVQFPMNETAIRPSQHRQFQSRRKNIRSIFPTKLSAQRSYSSRGCKSVQALTRSTPSKSGEPCRLFSHFPLSSTSNNLNILSTIAINLSCDSTRIIFSPLREFAIWAS